MLSRLTVAATVLATALAGAGHARAEKLLINQVSPVGGYGYDLNNWGHMSSSLNAAVGRGNITVSSAPLNNLSTLMGYDALWVTVRQASDPGLSAAEQANLSAFIATGRRVVLIGENNYWSAWNGSILAPVGGSYSTVDISGTVTRAVDHPLTQGFSSLQTIADGTAVGGLSLFSKNVATLWGEQQNTLSLLSANVIDDRDGGSQGNRAFQNNLAGWLASTTPPVDTPEPSSLVLLALGAAALVPALRRARTHLPGARRT